MRKTVVQLENEHVSVSVHDDATAAFIDRGTGGRWETGPVALQEEGPIDVGHVWIRTGRSICEQYPGRFRLEQRGDRLRATLLGRERREVGQFSVKVELEGPWVRFGLDEIDESMPSLVFPTPIVSESLVFPRNVGQWVRKPLSGRFFWRFYSQLNMRWFGGLRGDDGWIAVFDGPHHDAGVMAAEMHAGPAWLKSMGRWTYPRTVRYRFTTGGYVGLAKAYRQWAGEHGLVKTLEEKIEENPAVGNLIGGRILSFMQGNTYHADAEEDRLRTVREEQRAKDGTMRVWVSHKDTKRITEDALSLGMKGLVVVRGWIKGGYDDAHPDVWPPEPALGSVDELREICRMRDPLVVALHDNYADIYPRAASWPNGVFRLPDGAPMPGGIWAGGQCYIINGRDGVSYAKRNWRQIKTLDPRAMFIDTTTAVNRYESYEPGNELTRNEDESYKRELLQFYKEQGQVLGSEEAADFGIPYVDWLENRHHRVAGESIPLWPLVFHDCACCGRYGQFTADVAPSGPANWLADMLWGYFILWGVRKADDWPQQRDAFAGTMHVDRWHARIGAARMTSHRYLSEDGQLEQTEFSNGLSIIANFSAEERTADGVTVKANGYVIRE